MSKTANPAEVLAQWLERDLTAAAASGDLPPAFEVDDVLEQLAEIIESGRHPVLAGEPGVGKTAVIYELVRRTARGAGPAALAGRRVLQFSFRHRAAALVKAEQLRPETQKLWAALAPQSDQVVPFLRDFHVAYHANLEAQLQTLAVGWPGPILAEGDRATVLAMFEGFPELAERYVLLDVQEPDLERAQRILEAWALEVGPRGGGRFSKEALEEALQLCHRFLPRTRMPRKLLDLLGQVAAVCGPRAIGPADVLERFCRAHRVPRLLVDPRQRLDLTEVESTFRAQLLGQDEAVRAVVRTVGLIKAGLSDVRRPFGVFLFVGPTGVGKTHVAQVLAEYLFGSRDRLVRLNMADFQKEDDALVLFGNPEVFPPDLRRGILTQRLLGQPFAVLLLDELEKAHEKVHDRFLQLIDEGCFINGAGETVSCRANVIIATSNAGAEVYRGHFLGFRNPSDWPALEAEVLRRVQERFRFEFLNRFDQVVHFRPLTREEIRAIERPDPAPRPQAAWDPAGGGRGRARLAGPARLRPALRGARAAPDHRAPRHRAPGRGHRARRPASGRHPGAHGAAQRDRGPLPRSAGAGPIGIGIGKRAAPSRPRAGERRRCGGARRRGRSPAGRRRAPPAGAGGEAEGAHGPAGAAQPRARLGILGHGGAALPLPLARRDAAGRAAAGGAPAAPEARTRGPRRRRRARGLGAHGGGGRAQPAGLGRRSTEEGRGRLWVLIRAQDALKPARGWVRDLTLLELAWLRRLHLSADIVAYEAGEEPSCTVLDVEGPGAPALLSMEEGQHRLLRGRGSSLRARVDVIPQGPPPGDAAPPVSPVRKRKGHFGLAVAFRSRLQLRAQGVALDFLAAQREVLAHALTDRATAWPGPDRPEADLARVYGEDGRGARDPRTGATVRGSRTR